MEGTTTRLPTEDAQSQDVRSPERHSQDGHSQDVTSQDALSQHSPRLKVARMSERGNEECGCLGTMAYAVLFTRVHLRSAHRRTMRKEVRVVAKTTFAPRLRQPTSLPESLRNNRQRVIGGAYQNQATHIGRLRRTTCKLLIHHLVVGKVAFPASMQSSPARRKYPRAMIERCKADS